MTIEAELADGAVLEFPDGTAQSVIDATVRKHLFNASAQSSKSRLTPEQQAAYNEVMKNRPWGSGIPKLAYDIGGKLTDLTGSPAAGYAANVLTQAVPSLLSSYSLPGQGGALLERPAKALMQSAAKPTLEQLRTGKAARAIDTMLKEGYSPTKGGVEAMKAKIAELNDEIASALEHSTAMVDKKVVAGYLNDAVRKFEQQVNPAADVKAIEAAWTEFLNHPLLAGADQIPVKLAQLLKQGTYKALGEKSYGELKGAATEAQKTLARGLKEEISQAVPAVSALNKRESDLLNALKVAERRAAMDANKNPIGLGWLAQPWMIPFWMWDRSAGAKALTARALYEGSKAQNIAPFATAIGMQEGSGGVLSQSPEYRRGILSER